jgi:lysozyme
MLDVEKQIKHDEALRLKPYKDTMNKTTIGWGRNLQDNGISVEEAQFLFDNDMKRCRKDLAQYAWYQIQPQPVKDALLNMCFNLGINKLTGFRKMITALINRDYTTAAIEALDSKWATQVGKRAKAIALMIRQAE